MATPPARDGWGEAGGGDDEARRRMSTASGETVEEFIRVSPTDVDANDPAVQAAREQAAAEAATRAATQAAATAAQRMVQTGVDPLTGQDPWQQQWAQGGQNNQGPGQWGGWQGAWDWQQGWWDRGDHRGKDLTDPPGWPGWSAYRLWRRSIVRWNNTTDVSVHRRAERIFKTMDWDLQARFEHLSDQTLAGATYLDEILNILDTLAGEKRATEMRRTVRKALFEGARKSDESIAQFALRREQEFSMAEQYLPIPAELKGMMLEEQAGLGKQGALSLRTLTQGQTDFQAVAQALKVLDLEEESLTHKGKTSHFVGVAQGGEEECEDDDDDVSTLNEEDEKDILAEIEKLDLDEHKAMEVFVTLEKEKRTWKENKKLKLAQKKDRRHFSDRGSRPFSKGSGFRGQRRKEMNTDALRKVSRCGNCGERGHWAEDCRKPYRSKAERLEQERNGSKGSSAGGNSGSKPSAFVFLGSGASSSYGFSGSVLWNYELDSENADSYDDGVREQYDIESRAQNVSFVGMAVPEFAKKVFEQFKSAAEVFLSMPPGHAIIDPGAGQDLIGRPSYERLRGKLAEVGLRPIPVNDEPTRASGVGGQATTLFMSLIPTILGGAPGVVRVTVVLEDIPHLLSIGLLESAGSIIDTKKNVIRFEEHGTEDKMMRLKSGHRTLDVTKWQGGIFPVPEQVCDQYGLAPGAFNIRAEAEERVYMEQQPAEEWKDVEGSPFVLKVHSSERSQPYTPSVEESNLLGNLRVTLKQFSDGTVAHVLDDWKHADRHKGDEDKNRWTGITIFQKQSCTASYMNHTSNAAAEQGSSKDQVLQDYPNSSSSLHAARPVYSMESPGGANVGEEQGERSLKSRRVSELSASSTMHCGRGQPVRQVATLSAVPNEDLLCAAHQEAGEGEGESSLLRHEGLSTDPIVGPNTGEHGAEVQGEDVGEADGEEGGDLDRSFVSGQSGTGAVTAGDNDAVQSPDASGNDLNDVSISDAADGRTASYVGTDQEVDGEPSCHDEHGSTRSDECSQCHLGHGSSDEEGSRGVGSSIGGGEQPVRLDLSSNIQTALRPMGCVQLRPARVQPYLTEEHEVKVAWETDELYAYLSEEDVNDDHEVGISANVRRMVKKVLAKERGEDTSGSEVEKSDQESFAVSSMVDSERIRPFTVLELFSPPRVTAEIECRKCAAIQTTSAPAFDLSTGWDFFDVRHRKRFWDTLRDEDPDLTVMTPECKGFSILMNVNWEKMDPEEAKRLQTKCLAMFQFCIQVAEHRMTNGKFFLLEQPDGASSWNTHAANWLARQSGVLHVSFDQCMVGLQVHPDGPSKKRTAFMVNHWGIANEIAKAQCDGQHIHVPLEHGLPRKAQQWPAGLVDKVIKGISRQMVWSGVATADPDFMEDPVEEDAEEEEANHSKVREEAELSQEQKDMVKRLHVNMGHLPVDRMLVMLKAAKAQEKVIRYVRDQLHCEDCMRQRKEIRRRRAAFPRTFEFNRIVGVDVFYIKFKGKKIPFLNVVDHGSNWQAVGLIRPEAGGEPSGGNPTAGETWRVFASMWIRPHGDPEIVISDGGMEFRGRFERGLEQHSILQSVTDIQSPWQNGRVERHGQWLKDRLDLEVDAGTVAIENTAELEDLAMELVNCKNTWFSRGGYSPAQIVYGRNPRLPAELLSDANYDSPGWSDILCDPNELDTAGLEFKRTHQIRECAKKMAMEKTSREKMREASRPPLHKYRTWSAGQWVLVWRIATGGERARWIGPGLVILQNGHTVYVAMRSRLWKCNSDQLRPANSTEELAMQVITSEQYKDLLQQMQGQRTGAIDVAREGTPSAEAWRAPTHNPEEASTIREATGSGDARALPSGHREPADRALPGGREETEDGRGHPLRAPQERPTPTIGEQRQSRRASLETVPEPLPEPGGDGGSEHSADGEAKRRRIGELPHIPETEVNEQPEIPSSSGAVERTSMRANSPSASSAAATGVPTAETSSVAQRVQEIEDRPHMRRRSRSPLPEVLRRQIREQEVRRQQEGALFACDVLDPNNNWDAQDPTQTQAPWKEAYKIACVAYNLFSMEVEDPLEARCENLFGDPPTYFCLTQAENDDEVWVAEPARNGEITWSQMTPEEALEFQKSDLKEWESLEKEFKAVKIWRGVEAQKLREQFSNRIMTSRMVRRKKPMPGLHQYKAKSRFCVHGHKDPDSGTFRTFAPTPSTEALNLVCQVIANEKLSVRFADVKAAFAQSNRLKRPRGRLFVAPCEGVPLEEQDLIELIAPVYGLDDAPLRWFETVTEFLKSLGLRRSLLDPCVYVKYDDQGSVECLILLEVDDFLIAARSDEVHDELQGKLQKRFHFGKWEKGEADFIGRRIKQLPNEIRMDQEKYIVEKIEAVPLSKGRRSMKEAPLDEQEFKDFRSMLYKISWVAHQTRPEAAGTVSILSSRLHRATISDVITLNKMVGHLRSTSTQGLRIRAFESRTMTFIGVSDAGGVDGEVRGNDADGLPEDPVQGAWMVLTSNLLPAHDLRVQVSVLSWRSSKLKRRVTSTMASETMSLSQCLGELEWMQVFYRDLVFGDVNVRDWRKSVSPYMVYLPEECQLKSRQEECSLTDAKSLYDALYRQCPASRQDRRTALELAVIVDLMQKAGSHIRWTPHPRMPVDVLTKADISKGNGALNHLLKHGVLRIDKEEVELHRRQRDSNARCRSKRASEKLLRLEDVAEEDEHMKALSHLIWFTHGVWSIENCGSCTFPSPHAIECWHVDHTMFTFLTWAPTFGAKGRCR